MPLNWKNVKSLATPIQTTGNDVIFSGHGGLSSVATTIVPVGVELWILAPPGASIADSTGQALENMTKISMLGIKNPGDDTLVNNTPVVYAAGKAAPDYILSSPDGIVLKPGGPHIIGVTQNTKLSQLWARITPFIQPGKTLRCYWAACTAMQGAVNQVVLYQ